MRTGRRSGVCLLPLLEGTISSGGVGGRSRGSGMVDLERVRRCGAGGLLGRSSSWLDPRDLERERGGVEACIAGMSSSGGGGGPGRLSGESSTGELGEDGPRERDLDRTLGVVLMPGG